MERNEGAAQRSGRFTPARSLTIGIAVSGIAAGVVAFGATHLISADGPQMSAHHASTTTEPVIALIDPLRPPKTVLPGAVVDPTSEVLGATVERDVILWNTDEWATLGDVSLFVHGVLDAPLPPSAASGLSRMQWIGIDLEVKNTSPVAQHVAPGSDVYVVDASGQSSLDLTSPQSAMPGAPSLTTALGPGEQRRTTVVMPIAADATGLELAMSARLDPSGMHRIDLGR